MKDLIKNQNDSTNGYVKTTPENVREAHEGLFHATMNLPAAAAHCGMTQKQLKLTFWEYLKYHEPNFEVPENSFEIPRRKESSDN